MAFQQQINVMDYAKKAGKESRIADIVQDLQLQQAELPGEMGDYSIKQSAVDVGSSVLSDMIIKGVQAALIPATGGVSAVPTIFNKILGMAGKGTSKSFLSKGISGGLEKLLNIKAPEAPTVDMSRLTGPGLSGARQTIADMLEVSDVSHKGGIEGFDKQRQLLNFLTSFGGELKKPFGEFTSGFSGDAKAYTLFGADKEDSLYDWIRKGAGLGK